MLPVLHPHSLILALAVDIIRLLPPAIAEDIAALAGEKSAEKRKTKKALQRPANNEITQEKKQQSNRSPF